MKNKIILWWICFLFIFGNIQAEESFPVTVHYKASADIDTTLNFDFSDDWFSVPTDVYQHKLMKASLGMSLASYRNPHVDLVRRDNNIQDFFKDAGFKDNCTYDYRIIPTIDTIGTGIASKKIGDFTLVAVVLSGSGYKSEWLNNLSISDDVRPEGFNNAALKVEDRIRSYIESFRLTGELKLWVSGYSRGAAIANIVAADMTDSGIFSAVYGYTIATPLTVREESKGNYTNIFNIVGPFDPVNITPFPEWGYARYGINFYTPAQETDSRYEEKKEAANKVFREIANGRDFWNNPQANKELHMLIDYGLFYISSAQSYKETFQDGILEIWKKNGPETLLSQIGERIASLGEITSYQLNELYGLADYLTQVLYQHQTRNLQSNHQNYWQEDFGLQQNVMHEHYDEVYVAWIFSSDNPEDIFTSKAEYIHLTINGNGDTEIYDAAGDFVLRIEHNGEVLRDPASAQYHPGRGKSSVNPYADRWDRNTYAVLPNDQVFDIVYYPLETEEIHYAALRYDAEHIRGNVREIYYDTVESGKVFTGKLDPQNKFEYTVEDLLDGKFYVVEPWSQEVVYSPTAMMRLQNDGIAHPSPKFLFGALIGINILLLILCIVIFIALLRAIFKLIFRKKKTRQSEDEEKI